MLLRNKNRFVLEAVRNVMAHSDAWEGKWRGNGRLERVATTLALYLGTWSICICNALYWNVMYNPLMVLAYISLYVKFFFDTCIQTWRWSSQVAETCSWYGYLCYRIQLCYDWYILHTIVTSRSTHTTGRTHINMVYPWSSPWTALLDCQ